MAVWFPVPSLWGFGWWDWFSHSSGSAIAPRTQSPKPILWQRPCSGLYLQLGAGEREGKKNPGGTGVSGETGLGENDTDVALPAESL